MYLNFTEPGCSEELRSFLQRHPTMKFLMRVGLFYIFLVMFSIQLLLAHSGRSQTLESINVTIELRNENLKKLFKKIEKQTGLMFAYQPQQVDGYRRITLPMETRSVKATLDIALEGTPLAYRQVNNNVIIFSKGEEEKSQMIESETLAITVTGRVSDEVGNPMPGVNIIEKGTTNGTTTDADGRYSLSVSEGDVVLIFSFIGYITQEVAVNGRTVIDVALMEDVQSLEEVVVVGYGTVKRSDLTGSVTSVKSAEISAFPASNMMQALSGRAAGVQIKQNTGAPGAPISVRIRGTNSIQGSNEPLYVIDGFPSSDPSLLNNSAIESVEILKDASATAIYGSRGANGVVLITTRRGEAGDTKVDFESGYGVQTLRKKMDLMNATEYAMFYNEERVNDGQLPYFTQDQIDNFGEGVDWQNLAFRNAPIAENSLTVKGGTTKTQFAVSGSALNQQGIIKGSDYNRYSLISNLKHEISKKFIIDYGVKLSKIGSSRQNSSGGTRGVSLLAGILSAAPTLTPYNDDGTYRNLKLSYPFSSNVIHNPLYFINETMDVASTNMVQANTSLIFKPIEGLTINIFGGIDNNESRSDYYETLEFLDSNGNARVSSSQQTGLLSENTISYTKTLNEKHDFSVLAGFTYQDEISKGLLGSGSGFLSDVTETSNLSGASTPGVPSSYYLKSTLLSYLGRVNCVYDGKYLFTASFRADGSSKYSEGEKWGYFPSAALAWRVSYEKFMSDLTFISDLKLRTSWGFTGSQAIGAYATLNQLSSGKTVFGKTLYSTFAPGASLPGDLKWETTEQTNIGLDIAVLEGRFRLTADYYIKNTRDLLNTVQLPRSSGYKQTIQNVGQILNKGLEFSLDANILESNFKWAVNGNISFNRSEVVKLFEGQDILGGGIDLSLISGIYSLLREGEPMSVFYGYMEDGYDENGNPIYKDYYEDGVINLNDRTIIGDPNPDFIYGLNSNMSFKNFEFTIFWQGTYGNDIVNISSIGNTLDYGYGLNMLKEVFYDHWTPENTNAKYPKITNGLNLNFSQRFIEDGSYLRLRNIRLAYNIPTVKMGIKWLKNASVYASGQNLITLTKYSWWDPEVNSKGGANSIIQGFDHYTYPTAKTFTFGIKAGF